ncbi:MAG: hypothetical protein MPK07_01670, partial [Alphaproteobacteria bacterium]|nr:hypothetical protein [Alphaproteobacteria bacterium]
DASRWVRASPQKKIKKIIDKLRSQLNRRAVLGISERLTKTFTMPAQASDASRWVRASPQKKLKINKWTV